MAENIRRNRVSPKTRIDRWLESLKKLKAGLTTSMVIFIVIHVAMVVIGSINLNKCPASSNIPIFLIAEGAIGLISKLLTLSRDFLLRYFKVNPILSVIVLLEFAFFICGSIWVFGAFEPKYDPNFGELYCNKTTYLFALILVCCIYIIIFSILFLFVCASVIICVTVAVTSNDDVEVTVSERRPLPTN